MVTLFLRSFLSHIIIEYFNYIKLKIKKDSIFRLLSPLLQIFFGMPNSKGFKAEINEKMRNQEVDNLEYIFLKFVNESPSISIN